MEELSGSPEQTSSENPVAEPDKSNPAEQSDLDKYLALVEEVKSSLNIALEAGENTLEYKVFINKAVKDTDKFTETIYSRANRIHRLITALPESSNGEITIYDLCCYSVTSLTTHYKLLLSSLIINPTVEADILKSIMHLQSVLRDFHYIYLGWFQPDHLKLQFKTGSISKEAFHGIQAKPETGPRDEGRTGSADSES